MLSAMKNAPQFTFSTTRNGQHLPCKTLNTASTLHRYSVRSKLSVVAGALAETNTEKARHFSQDYWSNKATVYHEVRWSR